MDETILNTVKPMLGLAPSDTSFDLEILIHINTVFSIMAQINATPPIGFTCDQSTTWQDYFSLMGSALPIDMIKTYVPLRVRMIFDPPASGTISQAIERTVSELEWRIKLAVDDTEALPKNPGGNTND